MVTYTVEADFAPLRIIVRADSHYAALLIGSQTWGIPISEITARLYA